MPRPSKRLIAIRTSGAVGAQKRRKIGSSGEIPDSHTDGGILSEEDSSSSEGEGVIEDEPEDDILALGQLVAGWKEAERQLPGHSKTNAGKTPQSRWHYAQRARKEEEEKVELQKTYGDIGRFFKASCPPASNGPGYLHPHLSCNVTRSSCYGLAQF